MNPALSASAAASTALDVDVKERVNFLWSAAQTALQSRHETLANYLLNTLLKLFVSQDIEFGSDTAICPKCSNLLIPGHTSKVKLVPCEDLSDGMHAEMMANVKQASNLALSGGKQDRTLRTCLLYKCKKCLYYLPLPGTYEQSLKKVKAIKKALKVGSATTSTVQSSHNATPSSSKPATPSAAKPTKPIVKKDLEKKELLMSMLQASTGSRQTSSATSKQPQSQQARNLSDMKKPPQAKSTPPAAPKKNLFNFLSSL